MNIFGTHSVIPAELANVRLQPPLRAAGCKPLLEFTAA